MPTPEKLEMPTPEKLALGDLAEDMITGYKGVAVAFTKHITGCDRFTLQGPTDKDGKLPDAYAFDVTTIRVLQKGVVVPIGREIAPLPEPERKPGGPPTRSLSVPDPHVQR